MEGMVRGDCGWMCKQLWVICGRSFLVIWNVMVFWLLLGIRRGCSVP